MQLCSIVVATDLGQDADRALPLAADLARRASLPLEVLTVVTGDDPDDFVARTQRQLVGRHRLDRPTLYIEHEADVGRAIAAHVTNRQGALLVMATTGLGVPGEQRLGAITETVLQTVHQPVLVLGPNTSQTAARPNLPVAVIGSELIDDLIAPIASWAQTFSVKEPLAVEVIPPTSWPSDDDQPVGHVADYVNRMGALGLAARGQVIRADDAPAALLQFVDGLENPLLVMGSPRWEGDPSHWFVTVRRTIRGARVPVLVVPTELGGV